MKKQLHFLLLFAFCASPINANFLWDLFPWFYNERTMVYKLPWYKTYAVNGLSCYKGIVKNLKNIDSLASFELSTKDQLMLSRDFRQENYFKLLFKRFFLKKETKKIGFICNNYIQANRNKKSSRNKDFSEQYCSYLDKVEILSQKRNDLLLKLLSITPFTLYLTNFGKSLHALNDQEVDFDTADVCEDYAQAIDKYKSCYDDAYQSEQQLKKIMFKSNVLKKIMWIMFRSKEVGGIPNDSNIVFANRSSNKIFHITGDYKLDLPQCQYELYYYNKHPNATGNVLKVKR